MHPTDRLARDMRAAIMSARDKASAVGPQHSLWDAIFDAEAILAGKPTLLRYDSREQAIARLIAMLT